ncbi:calcium-binding protein [Nocardioides baculatus]|uniref:Calcium-binding protein n=1 Tax=Nocardioides baculatus TaxID=2801337 RepID=A0ABS1L8M1_9ACTN|nr:calcium-binding protein [Nocardioides baculatus]MBL0747878.1 calcium-binding protein [Nocardioides baculatus]
MTPRRPATTTAITLLLGALALGAPAAHADPQTCQGRAVTVTGDAGTPGDDVMVVGPGQKSVDTGAGNDLVCIRLDDSVRRYLFLGTGDGDDEVHNETVASKRSLTVYLGSGSDTYVGSDATGEFVAAGTSDFADSTDTERDVIDTRGGNDTVTSGTAVAGTRNSDVISTGAGDDGVNWAGEQTGPAIDLGDGDNRLRLTSGWSGSDVSIDAPRGVVAVDSRPVLRWSGPVTSWGLEYSHLRTTFTGADVGEYLTFWPTQAADGGPSPVGDARLRLDADMGGGDDRIEMLDAAGGDRIGGPGRDRLGMPRCRVADVRLGIGYDCTDESRARTAYSGSLDAWETISVAGGRSKVIGTNGPDTIRVYTRTARVEGRGGADVLSSSSDRTAKASRVPFVLIGGSGADRLQGGYSNEKLVGGRGNDTMLGGPGEDRIFGGPGRDRAVGQGGRDRCVAEVRRSCELR